jgi:hypothetical protein
VTVLWEAAERVCGKRLKPLIPMVVDAMERHGHLDLDPVIKTKVLQVSAATIDRVLAAARAHIDAHRRTSTHIDAHRRTSTHIDAHRRTSTRNASGVRAWARRSAAASRCVPSPIGSTLCRRSSRLTGLSTAAALRRMEITSTH